MARGTLRIYLGAAPGVGKTFAMLNEGWRRKERGTDVVVGYVETHGREHTAEQVRDLEIIPRRTIPYRGQQFDEMDVDAVLRRRPSVALVDELAHTNVPGSRNDKRWQDIEELLAAGITVISTVNIQHLESLNDVVQRITGVQQRETVPDGWVRAADQIELVDMTPEALRRRMAHGNIYAADKVDAALGNYFRVGNLSALRELALLWLADRVEEGISDYRDRHGIAEPWETRERVVVALTGGHTGEGLIRRGARMAGRAKAELVGVHVRSSDGLTRQAPEHLDAQRALLVSLGGRYAEVAGPDVAAALVDFARAENATQLLLGATHRSRFAELVHGSVINRVLRLAGSIDVHVISQPSADAPLTLPRLPGVRLARLSPRRRLAGWLLAVVATPLLALGLTPLRTGLGPQGTLLLMLLLTVVVATVGGTAPAAVGALVGFAFTDWYFITPYHTFRVERAGDVVGLLVFLGTAGVVSTLVDRLARRGQQVVRARSEAEALARLAGGSVLGDGGELPTLVADVRATFDLDAVGVLSAHDGRWDVEAAAGAPVPRSPDDGIMSAELARGSVLVLVGAELGADDRRLLSAFVARLRQAQEHAALRREAEVAAELSETNRMRTALLAAVSHDLRAPLATIKAAVTELLSDEVEFPAETVAQFLQMIDEETDRLAALVTNLLDMSRLQTGAFQLARRAVSLEEVVYAALASLSRPAGRVAVELGDALPEVMADAALLERALANVIDNALAWAPDDTRVCLLAGKVGDRVDLRVVDQGPGIPASQRLAVFQPFQRLGDSGRTGVEGVGLGLAVARGFVEAMDGEITVEDTPGGGTTIVITLEAAP
jgi:two-component system sensor histidine kinase KdpD